MGAVQIWPEWKAQALAMAPTAVLQVGVVEHDAGALAAQLEQQALHASTGHLADALARSRWSR